MNRRSFLRSLSAYAATVAIGLGIKMPSTATAKSGTYRYTFTWFSSHKAMRAAPGFICIDVRNLRSNVVLGVPDMLP